MYAQIILDIASSRVDRVFIYRVPRGMRLQEGMRVRAPFGPRVEEGIVLGLTEHTDLPESRLKDVLEPLEDYAAVLPALLELAGEIARETHCPLAEALRLMMPAGMRSPSSGRSC